MSARRHWSTTIRQAIYDRFDGVCQMCRLPVGTRGFDLDHAIPLAIGGEDVEANLRPLCRPCHGVKTKGDRASIAKMHRQRARHTGAKARSRHALPGGRDSNIKKRMDGSVVSRATGLPIGRDGRL